MNTQCPLCDSAICLQKDTEESEIISCAECHNRLVVSKITNGTATLAEAPKIEEDWGE